MSQEGRIEGWYDLRSTSRSYIMMSGYEFEHEGKFCKVFQVNLQTKYTADQSIKRYEARFVGSIKREIWFCKDIALGARHTSSVMDITLKYWFNQSKRKDQANYIIWDSL